MKDFNLNHSEYKKVYKYLFNTTKKYNKKEEKEPECVYLEG
jgi:hypothetical protein